MATVNKDFKIKSGLIVEGANATVNGNQILTENASDTYILNLIGGETLVKSVSNEFDVSVAGELSIDRATVDAYYDAAGSASDAQDAAETFATNADSALHTTITGEIATAKGQAETTAQGYANDAEAAAIAYADSLTTTDIAEGTSLYFTNQRALDATSSAYDASGSATSAENAAKAYADSLIADASTTTTNTWSAYKINTEIGLAQAAAESHADQAVANLVDGAPALLDTLNELAAALQDNPDVITNIQNVAAGKQDTLSAGNGIVIDNNDVIYVPTYLGSGITVTPSEVEIDRTVVDTWYDASGAASSAQTAAEGYASGLDSATNTRIDNLDTDDVAEGSNLYFTNQRAIDAVGGTISDQINLLDTDDIEEGSVNLYFTDARAKTSAADLLTGANLTNITITGSGSGLTITAENGVADSNTDDLDEGVNNLYFTDARAISAVSGADITPNTVTIDTYRKEEATQQYVANASTVNVHSLSGMYESVKYLVRVVGWDGGVKHSQITEILMTVDGNGNIAMTEYGNVHTSTNPLATFSAISLAPTNAPTLTATTAVNGCEVIAAATMLSWAD